MKISRSEEPSGRVEMPPMRWSHRRSFSESGDDGVGDGEEDVDEDTDEEEMSGAL